MATWFRPSSLAAGALAAACAAAHALDVETATPPTEITDGQAVIGSRTLLLPPGRWFYLDHTQKPIPRVGHERFGDVEDTVYLAQVDQGRITLSIRLVLLRQDIVHPGWDFPCPRVNTSMLFYKNRATEPGHTDCLYVSSRPERNYERNMREYSQRTADWLATNGFAEPVAMVYVRYLRFATNTYGTIGVLVPTEHFDSEATAIDWAESLREALRPWMEHRSSEARLPALPAPMAPEAPLAASAASTP